jgi:hypothetical protein
MVTSIYNTSDYFIIKCQLITYHQAYKSRSPGKREYQGLIKHTKAIAFQKQVSHSYTRQL